MERENQRIAITKRLLKEGMLRLLQKQELDKISVTALCREAGVNRATFYRHYEIPRDVLFELEKDLYHEIRQTIRVPKTPEDLKPCLDEICAYIAKHRDMLQLLINSSSDSDFALFISDIYLELWNEVRGMDIFQNYDAEDAKLISLFGAGGSYFLLRHWLLGNIQKSPQELSDYIYSLMTKTNAAALSNRLTMTPAEK